MAKRLIKVVKEMNVGLSTLVEHLNKCGFEIDSKPTAKVTDEMYAELVKEFQNSIAIKEKADQLIIGTRIEAQKAEEEKVRKEPKVKPEPVAPPPPPKAEEKPQPKPEEVVEKETPKKEAEETPAEKPKLKVLGKIDLDAKKAKPKKEKVEKPKEVKKVEKKTTPKPEAVEDKELKADTKQVKEPATKTDTTKATETSKVESKFVRHETPELRGLKILGKIDTDKLKEPKKKKKKKEAAPAKSGTAKPKPAGTSNKTSKSSNAGAKDTSRKKRKRTRRTVVTSRGAGRGDARNRGRHSRRDEVKEVSQKEIDDKIKATMAKLSGGGKKKRQRLRRENRDRLREKQEMLEQEQVSEKLQITEFISVSELASLMDVSAVDVIMVCMNLGVIVSINQRLDAEIIELVADEFGHEVEFISVEEKDEEEDIFLGDPEKLSPRAPVVTVMGHVDHGKTSLLDYIRDTKVAAGEAGGITQHIGAYEVIVGEKDKITFLDTPGHEAFTAMRARGAKVTDIAIIIIAADDNIMPQTREAISHAQAAGVPMVFAINKIDKPGAAPERIKQELASMNFLVEEWGGEYQSQDISAKNGEGIDLLLEKVLLVAELLELKGNADAHAIGTVIEASLDRGRGYVTKMLVQTGTLNVGDPIVAGQYSGKVKALYNELGHSIESAGPSAPVLVLGLDGAPQAGERFKEVESDKEARQIASKRAQILREQTQRATKRISLDEIGRRLALGTFKELNLIVKGDVDGSVEALADSLQKQTIETVQVNVILKAVGQIIESDVLLASASDAIIIGFQVRPSLGARKLAEAEGVEIKMYSVIYDAINEVRSAIEGMLEPTKEEKIVSQVEVREVYKISKVGTIAGCFVQEGTITRNTFIRLVRNGIVIFPTQEGANGEVSSLKRFKDDAKEVKTGLECGISIKNFNDIKVGDVIEGYEIHEVKQTLD